MTDVVGHFNHCRYTFHCRECVWKIIQEMEEEDENEYVDIITIDSDDEEIIVDDDEQSIWPSQNNRKCT